MKKLKGYLKIQFLIVLGFLMIKNVAYSQFSLSGEFRPRTEMRHGYRTLAGPNSEAAIFVSQRSRLNFDYNQDKYRTKLSVQDIRVWGDEEQLKDISSFSLHEAWAELDLSDFFKIKMGRQELIYDDHRLLGSVNWVQQARSHDAAVLKYLKDGWALHLGLAYNNAGEVIFNTPYTLANYKSLSYLWINKAVSDQFKFSIIAISEGFQVAGTTDVKHRRTMGPHFVYSNNGLTMSGTLYYQFGTNTADVDISANMMAFEANYKIKKVTLGLGIDRLSGTDALDTGNKDINAFHTLYATNHKFYGFMDYFLNIPAHTNQGGLTDIYAKFAYSINPKTSLGANLHFLSLSNNVRDLLSSSSNATLDKGLGTEIDLVFGHKIQSDVSVNVGLSIMAPSSSLEAITGGDKDTFQSWTWLMFTFKPTFFSSE